MLERRISIVSVMAVLALTLAGCQSERLAGALAETVPNPVCRTLHDNSADLLVAPPSDSGTRGERLC